MAVIQIGDISITETEKEGIIEYAWNGSRIYRIKVESYPGFVTNVYLLLDGKVTMIDVGLDGEKARADLETGLEIINSRFRQEVDFEDITDIIITHGHADHWGMLANPRLKGKNLYIHELDSEVLKDFQSRYARAKARIKRFVNEAGWDLEMDNIFALDDIQVQIDEYNLMEIHDGQKIINGYEVYHVPGHSPGHILLKVGPILFLGDHVLSGTTPHQLPGSLIEGCGLRLYLSSLKKTSSLGEHLGLPAHEETIHPIKKRLEEMEVFHYQRLSDILEICEAEKSLFRITDEYYRLRPEYINGRKVADLVRDEQILALEEIRAHIDYLLEDGKIIVAGEDNGVIKYRTDK